MALCCVLEVVVNTLLLHQSRNKIEVRLAVLHAIVQRQVAAGGGGIIKADDIAVISFVFGKNLLDDVRHREVLKDATPGTLREQPQPRNDLGCVVPKTL